MLGSFAQRLDGRVRRYRYVARLQKSSVSQRLSNIGKIPFFEMLGFELESEVAEASNTTNKGLSSGSQDLRRFPWITDPYISRGLSSEVSIRGEHVGWKVALFGFVFVLCKSSDQLRADLELPLFLLQNVRLKRGRGGQNRRGNLRLTCSTKMLNFAGGMSFNSVPAFSATRRFLTASTSFSNSRTAYSSVVLVSSTSSTIKTFLPTRSTMLPKLLKSSHCVRVTFVPGCSTTPTSLSSSALPFAIA